ncbi:multiple monosaccharide ABC transporter permease [Aureimonas pseudogalii]|uniref:Xylose transport system permease protein XylH n=1 Tax=Aureimonas pseudogalii TaxID=1744844 RepID=A0A7W6EHA2_9HYPH|nr:multiple monosaccharide ABC transporter permease [Aureimonas pseudogalii]MBB3998084.1 putative multiple sugar transport system permease protein [Aureimonas pseudogalii]
MSIKTVDEPAGGASGSFNLGFLKSHIREYGMLIALVVIMAFFQIMTGGVLMRPLNLTNLVLQNSYVVIMAIGMLLIIITGHIDLSIGSVAGFIGGLGAVLMVKYGLDGFTAAAIGLAVGGVIGAVQGYLVAYFKVPSFIVTLAGMLVFRGLTLKVLGSASVGPFPEGFQKLSKGFIPDFLGGDGLHLTTVAIGAFASALIVYLSARKRSKQARVGQLDEPFGLFVGRNLFIAAAIMLISYLLATYNGFPNVLIVMALLIAVYGFVTTRTTMGRRIYAVGGNEKAAKLSGIRTERLTFFTFVNMGVLAALAGLIFAARLNSATPKAGVGFELDVIAACFIGGASAYGGVGKVIGAVVGAFIIGVMNNGMSILGIGIDDQQVIKGIVLLAAVCFDVYNRNKA